MKTFKLPLYFLIALLVLGGIAFWDETATKKMEADKKDEKLSDLKASEIVSIRLLNRSDVDKETSIQLEKQGSRWTLSQPILTDGDTESIDRWLKTIEDLSFEKVFQVDQSKLQDFGLVTPLVEIDLLSSSGKSFSFKIGKKTPIGYSSYVSVVGKADVYVVNHYFFTASNKQLNDLRSKGLGFATLEEVQRFEFKTSRGEQINFSRTDNGWFLSGESETESIDSFKVSEFWKNLAAKKIESFLDDPSAELRRALSLEHGGTRSLGSLRQISRDGKEKAWHFFDNNSVVYAKIPGSAGYVTLDKSIEDVLKWSKVDFYDRSVFRTSFGALSYVKSQENTFEKKSDRWLDRNGKAADQVQLLISELEFLKYESVFSEADSIKLGRLLQKVELGFKDISPTVLEFFEQEGSQDYIFLKTENRIFIIRRAVLDNINAKIGIVEKEKISESK